MNFGQTATAENNEGLKGILDIEELSGLLDQFYSATGLSNFIVDLQGNILHGVGWKSICTEFHRKHKTSSERCLRSDTILANQLMGKEKYSIYLCQNGMVDAATPIMIDGVHVANFFIGQFFFETPDIDFFSKQAEEMGFDRGKYLEALEECHVYNKETILKYLDFFSEAINMIGESALKKINRKKQLAELAIANKELLYQNEEKEKRTAELVIANKELEFVSYHDLLTGLYNRRFYEEELKRLDTSRNLPITLVMGDVNGLKLINDTFGHAIGDELLKKAAEVIKMGCRTDDIIARIGGDEFVILLPKTSDLDAERIVERIKDMSIGEKVHGLDISISFGYKTKTKDDEDIAEIFKIAEDHMYSNKRSVNI